MLCSLHARAGRATRMVATVAIDPRTLAAYVDEIARAFGLDMGVIAEPRKARERTALIDALRARLRDVRPIASARSVGEVLDALTACPGPGRRARKELTELDDVVAFGAYARTKRAERGRIFGLLLIVFHLVPLTGVDVDADDPETALKLLRRSRR
jgi:hypothetical protein